MIWINGSDRVPHEEKFRLAVEELRELMAEHLEEHPDDDYLSRHFQVDNLLDHLCLVFWYSRFLPAQGRVLDWGCRHAPDSVLLKTIRGETLELHGCDFEECRKYRKFHEYCSMRFEALKDNIVLPYPDNTFDVVIGSGTLEHTAMDYESLKQVNRVLKNGGTFVLTHLPYQHSFAEYVNREYKKEGFHKRLYEMDEACTLLKRSGLLPMHVDYQERILSTASLCGTVRSARSWSRWAKWKLVRRLKIRGLYSALCGVAQKVQAF